MHSSADLTHSSHPVRGQPLRRRQFIRLVGGGTVRVVMDSGNFHQGDCVSVERGSTNNMRRVSSEYCNRNADVPEVYKQEHQKEANECAQAKEELLAAKDEAAVKTAHMKMNILCQD